MDILTRRKVLVYLVFFSVFFFIYSYKITSSYLFNTDIARDAYGIIEVAQGKPTLIGPKLNFGGLYAGPYYYWLFAPVLVLFKYSFPAILLFNTVLFSLAVVYFLYKMLNRYSLLESIVNACAVGLLPLFIITARNPGNAYTYIPALLVLATYCYFENPTKRMEFVTLGLLAGAIVNFHFLNILVVSTILAYLFYKSGNRRYFIYLIIAFALTFLPLLIFDLKHNFVVLEKTLYDFSQNSLIKHYGEVDNVSLFTRYLQSSASVNTYILFNPIFYFILFFLPLVFRKYFRKDVFVLTTLTTACFFTYALVANADMVTHYFFSVGFLLFLAFIIFCLEYRMAIVVFLMIIFELLSFPVNLYNKSGRPFQKFETAVNFVIDNDLIDKRESFNLIQVIGNDIKVPAGFEYRYFFRSKGLVPKSINEYDQSDNLFVFLEGDGFAIGNLVNWESGQFGQNYVKNAHFYEAGDIDLYKITKH